MLSDHCLQFSAHSCSGQMAGWIKMPLCREVGLSTSDIVLDGDPAPLPKTGRAPIFGPGLLWPASWMDQDTTWHGGRSRPRPHCARWGPTSHSQKRGVAAPISDPCLLWPNAGWMKMPLSTEVDLSPGHIVLDGDPVHPSQKGHSSPPLFGPCLLWPRSPISASAELLLKNAFGFLLARLQI